MVDEISVILLFGIVKVIVFVGLVAVGVWLALTFYYRNRPPSN